MRLTLPIAAFVAVPSLAAAQSVSPAIGAHIDSVFAAFATTHSPGCAVAVTRAGQPIFERGYGMASMELNVPITPRTVMDLGSVSKQFTAASILLLQLEGKLSLDDDVRRWLPELPDLGHTVTLRHLITHTSGWRDYNDILAMDGWDERDHTTDRDAWDALKRQRALNFAPGATYRYSNTGFFLLSEVVKRVTGRSLATFAQERIFGPLGMTQTRFLNDTRQIVPDRATAYAPATGGFVVEMSDWDQIGDGGVQSSVSDLAKWVANFESGAVGGKALLDLFMVHGKLNDGTEIAYTAGLSAITYRGALRVAHTGAWAGYRAAIVRFPQEHLGVILTCNRSDAGTSVKANRVAEAFVRFDPLATLSPAGGERHDGYFVDRAMGTSYTIKTVADTLFLADGPQPIALGRTGSGTYTNAPRSLVLRFDGDRLIANALGDVPDTLSRTEPVTRVPLATLKQYAGTYAGTELAVPYQALVVDSALVVRIPHGDDIVLLPVYADVFESEILPPIRFVRDAKGNVTAMEFDGYGVRGLRLTRQR